MTNICILNERFSDGGLSNVTRHVGEALSSDYTTYYYSLLKKNQSQDLNNYFSTRSNFTGEMIVEKIYRKIAYYYFEYLNKQTIDTALMYNKKINEFVNFAKMHSINIVILSGGLLTSLIPKIKEKLPKIKIVAWQHNNVDIYFDKYYKNIKKSLEKGLSLADLVVCLTNYDRVKFRKYNNNTITVYNPVVRHNRIERLSSLENKEIVFVSRYSVEQKGIDLLIKLAKELPKGWKISFAGGGNASETKRIQKLIKEANIENVVRLKGKLYNIALEEHYLNGSIFISTSRWEGFGLVLVEAMSFGLPIISFDTTGPKEILDDGKYGVLIPCYNIKKMAQCLIDIANNKDKRKLLQEKSVKRAKDFSIDNIIEIWKEEIKKLERE